MVIYRCVMCVCILWVSMIITAATLPGFPPHQLHASTRCSACGMVVMNYAGPHAQIVWRNEQVDFYGNLQEAMPVLLSSKNQAKIAAVYVQSFDHLAWDSYTGHWLLAQNAYYVIGSPSKRSAMGVSYTPFQSKINAGHFQKKNGGRVVTYAELKAHVRSPVGSHVHGGHWMFGFDYMYMPMKGLLSGTMPISLQPGSSGYMSIPQTMTMHMLMFNELTVQDGQWKIITDQHNYRAQKVILATGADPKSLTFDHVKEVSLYDALNPLKLKDKVNDEDCVAVFGSSHSSMIVMKNLLDSGVNKVINFYLTPHCYAVAMDGWILYDNVGLKAHTAAWVRKNISQRLDPRIKRYISNEGNIKQHLRDCNKGIYPVGFTARAPKMTDIDPQKYDRCTGIIAPGLFGAGIGYPLLKVDPLGGQSLNVGLYKFMNDIRRVLPIWQQYDL